MERGAEPLERLVKTGLLYDFYGGLLTPKQREAVELYYQENWSLAEIAARDGVSRQAVHDLLQRSEKIMTELETKLGLMERFLNQQAVLTGINAQLKEMLAQLPENNPIWIDLTTIRTKIIELIETE